uniref:histidine kinase n=1 Tax=Aplanochytrium stocchinoi TaxID=215587 RepID=A0A7S3LPW3_9STRA
MSGTAKLRFPDSAAAEEGFKGLNPDRPQHSDSSSEHSIMVVEEKPLKLKDKGYGARLGSVNSISKGNVLLLCLFVVGIFISVETGTWLYLSKIRLEEQQAMATLDEFEISFQETLTSYSVAVYGLASYASAVKGKVTGEGFRFHSENLFNLLDNNKPANFGYFKFVNASEKENYENQSYAYNSDRLGRPLVAGAPQWRTKIFTINNTYQTEYYPDYCPDKCFYPIQFVEPMQSQYAALNFDVLGRPDRQRDLQIARENGLRLTTPFSLIQEGEHENSRTSYSTALIVPVHDTLDFVDAAIQFDTLLTTSFGSPREGMEVYLYKCLPEEDYNMFIGGIQNNIDKPEFIWPAVPYENLDVLDSTFVGERRIEWGNEVFILHMRNADAASSKYLGISIIVAIFGTIFSGLLVYLIILQKRTVSLNARNKATVEAAGMIAAESTRADAEKDLNDFLSHEVRNPLSVAFAALNFVSSALKMELANSSPDIRNGITHDLDLINSSLQYIHELLNNMLDLSKATSVGGSLELDEKPVNMKDDVLQEIKHLLYRHSSSVAININCPPNMYLNVDALRLKQVLLNLGKNASKFVEKGFINFTAFRQSDEYIVLTVEDSGPGIPDRIRENLFQKYQFVGNNLRQGTGLGLCLCKALVEAMDGTISLSEDYNSGFAGNPGAKFVIRLPKKALSASEINLLSLHSDTDLDVSHSGLQMDIGRPFQVLVVDDEVVVRDIIKRSLSTIMKDYNLVEANSGEGALEIIKQNQEKLRASGKARFYPDIGGFDFIIIDHFMPGFGSYVPYTGEETIRFLLNEKIVSHDDQNAYEVKEEENRTDHDLEISKYPIIKETKIIGCSANNLEKKSFESWSSCILAQTTTRRIPNTASFGESFTASP